MKILITGGCGFIGTNLSLYLLSKGFEINTLDNLSRKGSKYNLSLLKKKKIKNFNMKIFGNPPVSFEFSLTKNERKK